MAFILVLHLSPDHKSILTDLLAKATSMPVLEAMDGMPIDPNRVFVIPPDCTLTVKDRRISISRPAPPRERRRPIDTFFFSLAEDQGENAICIVLSGTGTDGSLGLKTVKESGGLYHRAGRSRSADVPGYIQRLRDDSKEVELLFRELLIGVTQFFRDPEAFAALQDQAIARIVEEKGPDDTIRIWVPACSTGEEVYSITILVKEEMERQGRASRVQVFGTDLDEAAIAFARAGRYRKTTGLSSARLKQWFADDGDEVRPSRSIREVCVFSTHSVIRDAPFSKLDLISCRNLLIYLDHELQDRVLQIFRYALNLGGYLFLGPSEGVGRRTDLYAPIDKKRHIFQRTDAPQAVPGPLGSPAAQPAVHSAPHMQTDDPIERSARRALEKYSPVYVVIDRHQHILRFSGGGAGRYLEPSAGVANLDLLNNLRKSLRPIVRAAVQSAFSTYASVSHDADFSSDGKTHSVTIVIEPLAERGAVAPLFLVVFVERRSVSSEVQQNDAGEGATDTIDGRDIRQELLATKAQLLATVEDLETANEEMRSVAEEYQSVNEELQSTNEELETSKEEMQSVNEELQTINAEMFAKNEALSVLNSDFKNLLDSTQIATIFLDDNFCIKSFTPGMTEIFRVRESDRGRPISDIVTLVDYPDLQRDFTKVLRELSIVEREVQVKESNATFIMRIRPYRTVENVINGVVITFVDVTPRKRADVALKTSERRFAAIVNQATVGVVETDLEGRFLLANARYRHIVDRSEDEIKTLRLHDLVHPEDMQRERQAFRRLIEDGTAFQAEMRYVRPDGTPEWVHNSVSLLVNQEGQPNRILTVTQEISERKRIEEHSSLLLGELDHRVKNILAVISSVITQTLKDSATPGEFAADIEAASPLSHVRIAV